MPQDPIKTLYNQVGVDPRDVDAWTDHYFGNTEKVALAKGDPIVTYGVFVRHPTVFAPDLVVGWLKAVAERAGFDIKIESKYEPGDIVPAGEPQFFITGRLSKLVKTETMFLQRVGAVGVAAYNALKCVEQLPDVPFFTAGARHCVGLEMVEAMEYAAHMGTVAAQKKLGPHVKGFVNSAVNAASHFFDKDTGGGTTPHIMIGLFDSTLEAAIKYREVCPDEPFVMLVDYFGKEVTDSIEIANHFPAEAASSELGFRLDTHGGRYLEGLDHEKSIQVIHENAPHMMEQEWSEEELKILYGKGVSIAAIFHFKNKLAEAGFPNVRVVGSSGFNPQKCRMMAMAGAPLSGIGTGSYIPKDFAATYATADVFSYDGRRSIKVGREYLGERYDEALAANELHMI
ncbi:MAG: nicotinate phosphoribosyltransferase [Alphaproteobacteria bacterium]|nr:nicotinate phosphoribosyltransferase [Alphaproteobacteria bacterium]